MFIYILPIPCDHKLPSQHLREYVFLSLHKQPLLLDLGLVLLGVINLSLAIYFFKFTYRPINTSTSTPRIPHQLTTSLTIRYVFMLLVSFK